MTLFSFYGIVFFLIKCGILAPFCDVSGVSNLECLFSHNNNLLYMAVGCMIS